MFFDSFSSLLELYVGSNLASIVSDKFNKAIEEKVLSNYNAVIQWNTKIKSRVIVAKESLPSLLLHPKKALLADGKLNALAESFRNLYDEYELFSKEVDKTRSTESIKFLPFLSSFCALYSIVLLFIAGSCSGFKTNYQFWNSVLFFNFFSIGFIIFIACKREITISYPRVVFIFCVLLALSIVFYNTWPRDWIFGYGGRPFISSMVITSLVVPILHYILFIIIGSFLSWIKSKSMSKSFTDFESKFETFQNELNALSSFLENIDTYLNPSLAQNNNTENATASGNSNGNGQDCRRKKGKNNQG